MKFIFFYILVLSFFSINSTLAQTLPPIKLDYASYAVAYDGRLIGYYGEKRRVEVRSLSNISRYVIQCLIATEDRDFYNHNGVSFKGLARGLWNTITGSAQGGSTITMQLARNLFLTSERTISRKLTEMELAREIEKKYSKNDILLLYLNTVYFGHSTWGIWAASEEYFSKTPDNLSITESASLVGLLQSPSGYDPDKNTMKMLNRRNEVLHNLVETGKISEREFQLYKSSHLDLKIHKDIGRHFLEEVRKEAAEILKSLNLSVNLDELKVTTTMSFDIQQAAEDAVNEQWKAFPQSMKESQVGVISIEPGTGMIKAMVGGNPESQGRGLNRAIQIKRQPGSSFKPFLYGSMIKAGYTLAVPLADTPLVVNPGTAIEWKPMNSEGTFTGLHIPMEQAIQHSVNLAAAYAITHLTTPDSVVSFAHLCGIKSGIPNYPSIALGTGEVSPVEIAGAYSVFAADGIYAEPYSIIKIEDRWGTILYRNNSTPRPVLDSSTTYLVTKALQTVVDSGTASSVRKYYRGAAAGKTGTTQDYADAWFAGYNKELTTVIWIGFDNPQIKLKGAYRYGGTGCAPIWARMMVAISGNIHGFNQPFAKPESIVEAELCTESGELAGDICRKKLYPVDLNKIPRLCSIHYPEIKERYDTFTGF